MARARNLKPSFFQNEDLAACGPLGMLLFEGLWCQADRDGRLEDRPVRLKVQVLPYFDADCDSLLNSLQEHGFILRYEVEGIKYIQVLNFAKHQNPHVKEAASSIPAPDKNQTSTGNSGTSPADSPFPLTDSPIPSKPLSGSTPDGLDEIVWKRWIDYRKQIRKPLKPASILAAQRKLAAYGSDQAAVVEQSIANGWTGLFELKNKHGPPGKVNGYRKTQDEILAESRRKIEELERDNRAIASTAKRLE